MKKPGRAATPFWKDRPLVEADEIFGELAAKKGSSLFLGRFSLSEVISVLSQKGYFKEARKRFLWPLEFDLDSSEYPLQRFRIFLQEKKPENVIVDLKIRETEFHPRGAGDSPPKIPPQKTLALEWLTLQNPLLEFSEKRPRLPGQTYPGLRMSHKILDLFAYLGRLIHKDCLLAYPAYFHNALLFSRYFQFWEPDKEAEIRAIRRTFSHMPLHKLAWVVHTNCLRRGDGTVYEWKSEEQIFPLARPLKSYFDSRTYRERMKACRKNLVFTIDWAEFEKKELS